MIFARRTMLALGAAFAAAGLMTFGPAANAKPEPGQPAPAFTATDTLGNTVSLEALKGKTVVLEWSNHGCPYVRRHYNSGNMQNLQAEAADNGVVWLTIVSSPPGEQGHVTPEEANGLTESRNASPSHVILDPESTIARLYEARVTPHMYVIAPDGALAYMGGIDDQPHARAEETANATNYVRLALNAIKSGQPVETPAARPYGCSIKYAPEARS